MTCDNFRLALELKKPSAPVAASSPPERCGEVIDLGRGIKARYGSSDSPIQKDIPLPTQGEASHDAFLTAIRAFTRLPTQPPAHPLPPGYVTFDKNNLAQAELAALMGYEGDKPPITQISGKLCMKWLSMLMLYMTDALQDYLCMEQSLKKLPDFMRFTDVEKSRLDAMFMVSEH